MFVREVKSQRIFNLLIIIDILKLVKLFSTYLHIDVILKENIDWLTNDKTFIYVYVPLNDGAASLICHDY